MPFVILDFFTGVVPFLILRSNGPVFLLIPIFAVVAWNWWVLLSLEYCVVIRDDGSIEWIALAMRVIMKPEEVREVGPDSTGTIGFFRMKYIGGKVTLINKITGFLEVEGISKAE